MRSVFSCFAPCYRTSDRHYGPEAVRGANAAKDTNVHSSEPAAKNVDGNVSVDVAQTVQELSKLGDVLRVCSGIPGSSYHQLGRICGLLAEHFKVAYVSASVLSSTGITYLPIVAGGRLARTCPVGLPQFLDASRVTSFYMVAGQQRFVRRRVPGDELPADWEALRDAAGLCAFLAAAITVGSETVAVLTLADEEPDKFASPMWQASLELIGAFLGHLFRDRQLVGYCGVVEELMVVDSLDDLVRTLSRCVVRLQSEKLHLVRLTCRIACISSDASSAIIFDEALPFTSMAVSAVEDSAAVAAAAAAAARPTVPLPPGALPGSPGASVYGHSLITQEATGGGGTGSGGTAAEGAGGAAGGGGGGGTGGGAAGIGGGVAAPTPHGRCSYTPRGRLAGLSMVTPSSTDPYIAALVTQYQLRMHSVANLVPDPPDSGPGPPFAHQLHQQQTPGHLIARQQLHSMQLPCAGQGAQHAPGHAAGWGPAGSAGPMGQPQLSGSHQEAGLGLTHGTVPPGRLQSTGGAMGGGASSSGVTAAGAVAQGVLAPGGGYPGGRLGGGTPCISGLFGGCSLTGDAARDMGLWSALDPGIASNFSQQQLQVEGQAYLVENTLLSEAIANRAGVWIGDSVAFMQNPANPNADVFLAATAHHTTAMLLAVMWERSGGSGAAAALAAAAATGGSGCASGGAAAGGCGGAGSAPMLTPLSSSAATAAAGRPYNSRASPIAVHGQPHALPSGPQVVAAGMAGLHPGGPPPPPPEQQQQQDQRQRQQQQQQQMVGVGRPTSALLMGGLPSVAVPSCNLASSVELKLSSTGAATPSGIPSHPSGLPSTTPSVLPSVPSNLLSNGHSAVLAAFGSTFPRPSPQSTILTVAAAAAAGAVANEALAFPVAIEEVTAAEGVALDSVPAAAKVTLPISISPAGGAGGSGGIRVAGVMQQQPHLLMVSGDGGSGALGQGPSRGLLATLGGGALSGSIMTGRGAEQPLLAFYLLTSGSAPPSVLQELLVNLRELLVVLEPLVSSKLGDELSEEWAQLQREVLDKAKILKQPKDRTIVLRNTAAQLGTILNSRNSVDDPAGSTAVSDSMRPPSPSPRVHHQGGAPARYTGIGAGAGVGTGAGAAAGASGPAVVTGGVGAIAAAAGAGIVASASISIGAVGNLVRVDQLRSVSDKSLFVRNGVVGSAAGLAGVGQGGGAGGAAGAAAGAGAGGGTGGAGAAAAATGVGVTGGAVAPGGARQRTPSFLMSRSFTGKRISALISGVQDRVQQAQRMSVSYNTLFSRPDDLRSITMLEKLGSGGFGTVYLGLYQGTEVAVKVILERDCEGTEVLRNAVELAVLSTLSHPNIVQVLTFFTDVTVQIPPVQARLSGAAPPIYLLPHGPSAVQMDMTPLTSGTADCHHPMGGDGCPGTGMGGAGCAGGSSTGDSGSGAEGPGARGSPAEAGPTAAMGLAGVQRPHGQKQAPQPAPPPSPAPAASSPPKKALVILMEYCDAGCLADAIRNGLFRENIRGGYGAQQPAWSHIYLTLLEVALALRYLHSINLVHRDLKPQNVLLKSSPSDVRGFTTKLSDFGLVKLLTEADVLAAGASAAASTMRRQRRYSGTVSHVAPEAIHHAGGASAVDVAVDIYAFGIVMWEILTGQPVYLGLTSDQIIERVQTQGLRPSFPPDTPSEYTSLAHRCWDVDPRQRPSAEELVQQMSALSSASRTSKATFAVRRRLSTLSNKELLRNVANANAAAHAACGAGAGGGGGRGQPAQRHNEDDFPLHIL